MAEEGGGGGQGGEEPTPVSRPDAVVQAMRVLEVQEHLEWESASLERPPQEQEQGAPRMEDPEKALLRQMCNVSGLGRAMAYPLTSLAGHMCRSYVYLMA